MKYFDGFAVDVCVSVWCVAGHIKFNRRTCEMWMRVCGILVELTPQQQFCETKERKMGK